MKSFIFCFLSICFSFSAINAQTDTVFNQLNGNGQKQGFWKKYYPNGNLMYVGEFEDNNPIGKMTRYYQSGGKQAIIEFYKNSKEAKAILFYEDGERSAEGYYFDMQKDSLWKYYSFYTSGLVSDEFYIKGKKNGIHHNFYENGQVSEEIEWKNDNKEGKWIQYFPDGKVKMKSYYSFNMVNGRYYFYHTNGLLMILGNFSDNKRHGPWAFYDEQGKEKYKIEYDFGVVQNGDELIKSDNEYFKMIDENIGKFEDPSLEDFYPGNNGY